MQAGQLKKVELVVANDWDFPEACDHVEAMFRKYINPKYNIQWVKQAWKPTLDKVLMICRSDNIDPEMYLEAQFAFLYQIVKEKMGGKFYPNMLLGNNALVRYERFRERNKRHTTNVKAVNLDCDQTATDAESTYGEILLKAARFKESIDRKTLFSALCESYPGITLGPGNNLLARRKALCIVADSAIPGLSSQLTLTTPDFDWDDAIAVILKLAGIESSK